MELRHIKYFLTLAEELHFRRAAEQLFIAQPALTRQIKDLEEQLGTTLFKRDKRNVSLTPSGRYLQKEGYQLLRKVDVIQSSIVDIGSTFTGVVNIGCIGSAMTEILPGLISEMSNQFPSLRTNIIESTTTSLLHQLQDGQIDLMIGRPHQEISTIHSEKVFEDSTTLVKATHSRWDLHNQSSLSALRDIPFIIYPRLAGPTFRDQLIKRCTDHGFHPVIRHESINAYSILRLVEKDIGISVLPKSIAQGYNLKVDYLKMDELNIPLEIVVSYRTDLPNEIPKEILKMIKRRLSDSPLN